MSSPEQGALSSSGSGGSAPVPDGGSGVPLTRRQLRELAAAQEAAEQAGQARVQDQAQAEGTAAPGVQRTPMRAPQTQPSVPSASSPMAAQAPQARAQVPAEPPVVLSRRELRERAAALANTQSAAPSRVAASRPVPVVQPPAVTGAIRALDETGQLTPVRPVSAARSEPAISTDRIPGVEPEQNAKPAAPVRVARAEAAAPVASTASPAAEDETPGFSRVGVRESIAQVQAQSEPRVYPHAGATPGSATPLGQRTPLSTMPGAAAATAATWAPVSASTAPVTPAATAPIAPAAQAEVATQEVRAQERADEASDEAVIPQWGTVLGADDPAQEQQGFGFAPVPVAREQDYDDDDDSENWLRYTPLQYLVLIVLGLILGGLVWQLLNSTSQSGSDESASSMSHERVIETDESYV